MAERDKAFTVTPTHLVVSQRGVLGVLVTLAVAGVALAASGLRAAYATLGGPSSTGGTIVTVAIIVAATTLLLAFTVRRILTQRIMATRTSAARSGS